jgi:uncharacterized membrane protein YjfL (UPF0719 family)
MFVTRVLISLFEFLLAVVMSGMVIYLTYRVFIKANPDFDMEEEIKKGNVAVGTLVGAILFAASTILHRGMDSVVSLFRLHMTTPSEGGYPLWQLVLMGIGHLTMSMVLAVLTISITLRLFGRMTTKMEEGKELQRGNMAVGILLSSVVLVASMYVGEGVSALSKALVPQTSIGRIQILR